VSSEDDVILSASGRCGQRKPFRLDPAKASPVMAAKAGSRPEQSPRMIYVAPFGRALAQQEQSFRPAGELLLFWQK
jgi:hypothetical protein